MLVSLCICLLLISSSTVVRKTIWNSHLHPYILLCWFTEKFCMCWNTSTEEALCLKLYLDTLLQICTFPGTLFSFLHFVRLLEFIYYLDLETQEKHYGIVRKREHDTVCIHMKRRRCRAGDGSVFSAQYIISLLLPFKIIFCHLFLEKIASWTWLVAKC